jgi:hypothetical protein
VHQLFRDGIRIGQPLPLQYQTAICHLDVLLTSVLASQTEQLQVLLPSLRGFEGCFAKAAVDKETGQHMAHLLPGTICEW